VVISSRTALSTRFGDDAGLDVPLGHHARPIWRGRVHLIALYLAAPSLAMLIVYSDSARARIAACVYAVGLFSMFAVSTTYHRWVHHLRLRAIWRRADHAMIFAAIAGSATPVVLIAVPGTFGIVLIALVWATSFAGAACKLARWHHGNAVGTGFYAAVSLLSALAIPQLWVNGGVRPAVLVLVGGLVYIVGAIWFAKNYPKLRPSVFSFHEVWHVFTVVAAGTHFAGVWAIAT
jgi:hemolysin III